MSSNKYGDKYIEINEQAKKAIKKFDETCEKIAKNKPKVWLTVEDAKFVSKLLPMSILWCGSLETYGVIKELNDRIKQQIEQAEK